jgi:hypothetical protein
MDSNILTQEYVQEIFKYKDGELYWKISKGYIKAGFKAGCIDSEGYKVLTLSKKTYKAHRIIFLYHHGYLPKEIDHIDNNKSNNLINNLRAATRSNNAKNVKLRKNNTSGVKNVRWNKDRNKWEVKLLVNGKRTYFGWFDNLIEAAKVAENARNKHHKEFANHL